MWSGIRLLIATVILSCGFAEASSATSTAPAWDWQLSGGVGERFSIAGRQWAPGLRVAGDGTGMNCWQAGYPFEPGRLYRMRFRYRRPHGTGAAMTGPPFANRDFGGTGDEWTAGTFVFAVPTKLADTRIHLGQWMVKGTVDYMDPEIIPVQGVHRRWGEIQLGSGEDVAGTKYRFDAPLSGEGSNFSRPLGDFNVSFNSDRWVFSDGLHVTYRHRIGGYRQKNTRIEVNLSHHTQGRCVVEASRDGVDWVEIGSGDKVGSVQAGLLTSLPPADEVFVRIRAAAGSAFQVNRYAYTAELDGPPRNLTGETVYLDQTASSPDVAILVTDIDVLRPGLPCALKLAITNMKSQSRTLILTTMVPPLEESAKAAVKMTTQALPEPGQTVEVSVPVPVSAAGRIRIGLAVTDETGNRLFDGSFESNIPALYAADFGESIDAGGSDVQLWWCDAPRKISRGRPAPSAKGAAVRLQAAGDEFEAAQLVVRPRKALSGLTVTVGDLRGPAGVIAASNVQVLRVRYVSVRVPTDSVGVADEWPDPLPPLDKPLDIPANVNQPLWVLVHVPEAAAGGDYEGSMRLTAGDWSASVPIRLHVWSFSLPKQPRTQSALGLSMGNVWRYQGLTEEAQRRAVWAKYMQCFADHRISPYDPTPFDPYEIKPVPDANPPKVEINFSRFDAAMQEAIERWHITSFNLRIPGMGWGTFESRQEGEIAGFKAGTPQYEAMFSSAARQIEEHLRQKGWLDKGYIYWFDEPEPRDYDFVRKGMERLKKCAPGLCRMLTEEPSEPLFGAVDLWCPISPAYSHQIAETRREKGERFWWYVCCGPRAPFCTLFIDHTATEMRTWLWQTWQRKINGILIWETTYWTSDAAFPGSLQNPYVDPMSYVAGVANASQTRSYWGNGDGRFIYPPEAAAAGSKTPILDGPVSCIRWEMLRDGIEDLDYLHILDGAIRENRAGADEKVLAEARSLLSVPPEITKSTTEFATDPAPILERREAVARMIERLVPSSGGPQRKRN